MINLTIAIALAAVGLVGLWLAWRMREPETASAAVHYLIPGDDDEPLTPREMHVSGVNKTGLCGKHRQDIIAKCRKGDPIYLVRQPDNPHDENAVILYSGDGKDIGFLPREVAAEIAPRLDRGSPVTAVFDGTEQFETEPGRTLLGAKIVMTPYRLKRQKKAAA